MTHASRCLAVIASLCAAIPFSASAAGFIINCMTIATPGPWVLTRNLTAAGDCLVIQSDFVALDLGGFVITGNGTGAAITEALGVGRRGVAVRNGVITNFQRAIMLSHSPAATVENINATANAFDAIVLGDMAAAKNNTVANNGGMGMRLGQRALATGNTVNENVGNGIFVDLGGNVAGNTVGRNHGIGIAASEGALIVNNVSRNNGSHGISVDCPSAVITNTTSNNLGDNLHIIGGACDPNSQACCVVTGHNSTL